MGGMVVKKALENKSSKKAEKGKKCGHCEKAKESKESKEPKRAEKPKEAKPAAPAPPETFSPSAGFGEGASMLPVAQLLLQGLQGNFGGLGG